MYAEFFRSSIFVYTLAECFLEVLLTSHLPLDKDNKFPSFLYIDLLITSKCIPFLTFKTFVLVGITLHIYICLSKLDGGH